MGGDTVKVVYVLSEVGRAVAFEWIADHLDPERFELEFVLLNPGRSALEDELRRRDIPCTRIPWSGYGDLFGACRTLRRHLRMRAPEVVHAHLLPAGLVTMIAARTAGVPRRIYTRHHSTFHHDYARPWWSWVDRIIQSVATDVVAISENVRRILIDREGLPAGKVHLVHHGFRVEDFDAVTGDRVQGLRERYGVPEERPVVGVVARYIEWKGHRTVVRAARKVLERYPEALFVFANARGDDAVRRTVHELPEPNRVEIEFEDDLFALYRLFDVYVHTPVNAEIEAFGQTYVEALLAGVPSVFTLSGVAREFVEDGRNAVVVPYRNPGATAGAILRLLDDREVGQHLAERGRTDVEERFAAERMIEGLEAVYSGGRSGGSSAEAAGPSPPPKTESSTAR